MSDPLHELLYKLKIISPPFVRPSMDIDYITNTGQGLNIGSRNQALGVVEALEGTYKRMGVQVNAHEYDLHNLDGLKAELNRADSNAPHIVVVVGDDGVRALDQIPRDPGHISVLIGHEVPKGVESVKDRIDILAVPEHVTDYKELEGVQTVRTHGVSHAMTAKKTSEAAAEWRNKLFLDPTKPVVVAMLGGTVDGKDYTPEEARQLGEYVAAKAKERDAYVLMTHSPRARPEAIAAFGEALDKNNVGGASFPYMRDQSDIPFKALIGIVSDNEKSLIVSTGDSVSMPCEARSSVAPCQLTIYSMSNQNPQNTEFVKWMHEMGQANIVTQDDKGQMTEQKAIQVAKAPTALDAARQIAAAVNARLNISRQSSITVR